MAKLLGGGGFKLLIPLHLHREVHAARGFGSTANLLALRTKTGRLLEQRRKPRPLLQKVRPRIVPKVLRDKDLLDACGDACALALIVKLQVER